VRAITGICWNQCPNWLKFYKARVSQIHSAFTAKNWEGKERGRKGGEEEGREKGI